MINEEKIKQQLIEKFPVLNDKIVIKRQRRIFGEVSLADFSNVFDYAVKTLKFSILTVITGLDEGTVFGAIYHLSNEQGIMLNLHTTTPRDNPLLQSVTKYFPSADAYERELVDLLGIKVEGLPQGNRYPLPDGWPENQYPLRKDWKGQMPVKEENK
jgi:Ni,Fe-hydrogenase III component G